MRIWMNLFEGTPSVREVFDAVLADMTSDGTTAHVINHGECEAFADNLASAAPTMFQSISIGEIFRYGGEWNDEPEGFDEKLLSKHWPTYKPFPGTTWQQMFDNGVDWPGIHVWAYSPITNLCYDAETPDGVSNPFDLSFFDEWKADVSAKIAS